jgi:hypothetical protein
MSQSELIGGALIGGFVLYLAMNNRLQAYWSILMGAGAGAGAGAPTAPATPPGSSPAPGSSPGVTRGPGAGTAPGNTGAGGTLVQPTSPFNPLGMPLPVPGVGLQLTPGMQGN